MWQLHRWGCTPDASTLSVQLCHILSGVDGILDAYHEGGQAKEAERQAALCGVACGMPADEPAEPQHVGPAHGSHIPPAMHHMDEALNDAWLLQIMEEWQVTESESQALPGETCGMPADEPAEPQHVGPAHSSHSPHAMHHMDEALNDAWLLQIMEEWQAKESERQAALSGVAGGMPADEPAEPQYVAYVPLPDQKEIELRVVERKKAELLAKYSTPGLQKQQQEAIDLLKGN